MRVAHYLIRGRSGLFYFRLRVPADLRPALGRTVIKRAIGTRCPRVALRVAVQWAADYSQTFLGLREGSAMTKPPKVEDILASFARGNTRPYVIETGPQGLRISATDAADHSRAMDALDRIGALPSFAPVRAREEPQAPAIVPKDMDEAIRLWALSLPRNSPGKKKTSNAKERMVREFHDWKRLRHGKDYPVNILTRTDFAEFFIYAQNTKTARGKLPAERYVENKFLVLADFLDWASTSGFYPKDDNPARGHANVPKRVKKARAKSHGWQPFTAAQLAAIFNPDDYASMESDAARWLPLIALYTGARSNEMAHLELADCYVAECGAHVLDFNLLGDHKSLKTDASERKTPVHPDLIALGLWERVERLKAAGETKLFPGLNFIAQNGPANGAQRAFSRYLERLNIEARGGGKVGHHSFRDTVIEKLKKSGVARELREEYTGHELSDRQEHSHAYDPDFTSSDLGKACHPALSWTLDLQRLRELLR